MIRRASYKSLLESGRNASHYRVTSHSLIKTGHVYVNIIPVIGIVKTPVYHPTSWFIVNCSKIALGRQTDWWSIKRDHSPRVYNQACWCEEDSSPEWVWERLRKWGKSFCLHIRPGRSQTWSPSPRLRKLLCFHCHRTKIAAPQQSLPLIHASKSLSLQPLNPNVPGYRMTWIGR